MFRNKMWILKKCNKTWTECWQGKILHGQFLQKIKRKEGKDETRQWLTTGTLRKRKLKLFKVIQWRPELKNHPMIQNANSAKKQKETVDHILN